MLGFLNFGLRSVKKMVSFALGNKLHGSESFFRC